MSNILLTSTEVQQHQDVSDFLVSHEACISFLRPCLNVF